MTFDLLAQRGADWLEIVIFLLVVGFSAFGAIAQALIKKFGGKKGEIDKPEKKPRRKAAQNEPDWRPVARPMPQQQARRTASPSEQGDHKRSWAERIELPDPLREVLSEVMPEIVPPKPAKKIERSARKPTPASPAAPPKPDHREISVPPARPVASPTQVKKIRQRPSKPQQARPAPVQQSTQSAPGTFEESLNVFEDHLGHLEYDMGSFSSGFSITSEWDTPIVAPGFEFLRNPDRAMLRKAIVMSELLAPPLALRQAQYPTA
jgi:hypothetical protein